MAGARPPGLSSGDYVTDDNLHNVQLHLPPSRVYNSPPASPKPLWTNYDPYFGASYTVEIPNVSLARDIYPKREGTPVSGESGDEDTSFLEYTDEDPRQRLLLRKTLSPGWKLNYQDFVPDLNGYDTGYITCQQNFRDIIDKANSWLRQNPHIKVKSCETITWMGNTPKTVGDSETVVLEKCQCPRADEDTYHVTGLRLWVSPQDISVQNTVEIGSVLNQQCVVAFRDFIARSSETWQELVPRVNSELDQDWVQGHILSLNSVFIPDIPNWDPARLLWRESQCRSIQNILVLRLFYIVGEAHREHIGIKDIVPEANKGNSESFSLLMKKATCWIRKETTLYITNLQSVYVTVNDHAESAAESSAKSCQSFRDHSAYQYFQVLRLYYIKRPVDSSKQSHEHHVINCMTFTPVQTTLGPNTEAEFERMKQTMSRISAWLELAGAVIRSAETFITPIMSSSANHTLPEMTSWNPLMVTSAKNTFVHKHLMHIRVYLEGDFSDPDPRLLPPLPYSLTVALQSTIQEREYKKYYKQKKTRQKRRKITVLLFLAILLIAVGIILFDQLFDIFHRFP